MANTWVRYFDRSYQQIKDRVLRNLGYMVPEITDHTESNPWVQALSIWSAIAEMLGYYIDNAAREAHLSSARLYWSAVKIANSYDYRIRSSIASTGFVTITSDIAAPSDIVIPIDTKIETDGGVEFRTTAAATIVTGETSIIVSIKQVSALTVAATVGESDGTGLQVFELPTNTADSTITTVIDSIGWTLQDTLAYSIPTDTHYKQTVNASKIPVIVFGDEYNGKIPTAGLDIIAQYRTTLGDAGNVPEDTITNLDESVISIPSPVELSCTNSERTSGGAPIETLDQIKTNVPKSIRTLDRAVTELDFKDITELASGVIVAGVIFTDIDSPVEIFIVPEGGGVAAPALITSVTDYVDLRKTFLVNILVGSAGEVRLKLSLNLNVLAQYQRATVVQNVLDELTTFLSYKHQDIKGAVRLSDLYNIIESVTGVDYSNIIIMTPQPYGRPINGNIKVLNLNAVIKSDSSTTIKWRVRCISTTQYELYKESDFMGQFVIATTYAMPEMDLTIADSSQVAGDEWVFYTYPYFGSLILAEPSLIVSLEADITINATGGLT